MFSKNELYVNLNEKMRLTKSKKLTQVCKTRPERLWRTSHYLTIVNQKTQKLSAKIWILTRQENNTNTI